MSGDDDHTRDHTPIHSAPPPRRGGLRAAKTVPSVRDARTVPDLGEDEPGAPPVRADQRTLPTPTDERPRPEFDDDSVDVPAPIEATGPVTVPGEDPQVVPERSDIGRGLLVGAFIGLAVVVGYLVAVSI